MHDEMELCGIKLEEYMLTNLEIWEKLASIISKIIDEEIPIDESLLLREFDEDKISLGLSSLDMMDLLIQIEMEFEIEIEQESYVNLYDLGNLVQKIIKLLSEKSEKDNELAAIQKDLFN